jgi:glutathione synthase/RimK-type ligase-like ATP-grasp enzyme
VHRSKGLDKGMSDNEKRIGLLIGREWSWPSAFITEVNKRDEGVIAEFIKLGGTFMDEACTYDVIVDRMSHEIPYYRNYLKYAAINGCYVINNPFAWSADDKFFGIALGVRLDMTCPRTVMLPNKRVETENVPESFRNLVYPMDWQGIIDYVGVPAILKDVITGGRRVSRRVHNVDELIQAYDESDTQTVLLQSVLPSDYHVHCMVVGQEKVLPLRYAPDESVYLADEKIEDDALRRQIEEAAVLITRAYGYDVNMVEFIVRNGAAYLINPTNPAPDMDINLLTPRHFSWCVNEIASLAIARAKTPVAQFAGYSWFTSIDSRKHLA